MTIRPDPVTGREPERERAPSRARLVRLVLEGYVYLAAVVGMFVVAVAFLVWGLVNRRPLIGLIAVLIGVPVLVTTIRAIRALFFTRSRPEGIILTPQFGGAVLTAVEEIRKRVHAPKVHEVLITDQFNAAALQIPRAGLFWPRNTLLLGYPMLATLSDAHIRAVIAHELGHLTQGHGRLAAWVHRTRLSWSRLMHDLGEHGATPAHAHLLFRWYVPRLVAQAAAVSRQQERLADRLAADVAGADTTAETLVAMEIGANVFDRDFWPGIRQRVESEAEPPSPFAEMGPHIWAAHGDHAQLLRELLDRQTVADDSHPSLGERLGRLGGAAQVPSSISLPATNHLLGESQREIASILDRQWQATHAENWREEHDELRRARERLAVLAAIDSPTPEQLYEHGELLERDGRADDAMELYQSATAAGHAAARLAAGRLLLERHDAAGLALIEAAMDAQSSLVDEGCRTVIAFLEDRGQHADAERFRVRQTRQATLTRMAAAECERLSVVDRFAPCSDARVDAASVARRLASEPMVSRAFLVAKELRHSSGTQTVLALMANEAVQELSANLKREGLVPEHVEIVGLDRRDHQLRAALEQTPGALFYERTS